MQNITEKLDSYQILTNLFPGIFFGLGLRLIFGIQFPTNNVAEDIIIYYFLGLIIGRIGSIVLTPLLKKVHLIKYTSYTEFIDAEKCDAKISVLLSASNYARSMLTCVLFFPVVWALKLLALQCRWFASHWKTALIFALICLFFLSYKKQTDFIYKRVKAQTEVTPNHSKIGDK